MIHTELPPKIDKSLARGIVRNLLDQIDTVNERNGCEKSLRLRAGTTSGRKAGFTALVQRFKPVLLDIVARDKTYRSGGMVLAMSSDFATTTGTNSRFLCAVNFDIDMQRTDPDARPVRMIGHLFAISPHALTRIVQRQRVRETEPLLDMLRTGSAWAQLANGRRGVRTFMAPTREGLLCCGMDTRGINANTAFRGTAGQIQVANLRTFVGLEQMRPDVRERWQRLVDAGALEDPPRLLRRKGVSDRHREIFEIMLEEGRDWDARRAMSIQRRQALEMSRGEQGPIGGLFNSGSEPELSF